MLLQQRNPQATIFQTHRNGQSDHAAPDDGNIYGFHSINPKACLARCCLNEAQRLIANNPKVRPETSGTWVEANNRARVLVIQMVASTSGRRAAR